MLSKKLRNISRSWFTPNFSIFICPPYFALIPVPKKTNLRPGQGRRHSSRYHPDLPHGGISNTFNAGLRPGFPGRLGSGCRFQSTGPHSKRPLSEVFYAGWLRHSQNLLCNFITRKAFVNSPQHFLSRFQRHFLIIDSLGAGRGRRICISIMGCRVSSISVPSES